MMQPSHPDLLVSRADKQCVNKDSTVGSVMCCADVRASEAGTSPKPGLAPAPATKVAKASRKSCEEFKRFVTPMRSANKQVCSSAFALKKTNKCKAVTFAR